MPGPRPNVYGKNVPKVNGVIPSLGWVYPITQFDNNYYEPEGGLKASTQKDFKKLLRDRFGLDFEADFRGSFNRVIVTNSRIKGQLEQSFAKLEEYEIMPESKETYELRQKEAESIENALFYEMAKGGLAIIPPGEVEPRQVRCDVTSDSFVVTEPYSQCAPEVIMKKYKVHQPVLQPVPPEPQRVYAPVQFTDPEPKWPDKPDPVTVNPPGREPVPAKFMKRPEPPNPPQDPMRFGSKEALAEDIFKKKLEESGLKEPTEQLRDPGDFDMDVPDEVKKPDIVVPEPPVKPEACYIEDQMYEALSAEAPVLDRRILRVLDEPEPFTDKEPVRPVMVKPAEVPNPVYLTVPDSPKIKYQYEFEEPEVPIITTPEEKLPNPPVLDLSDLEEPKYPEDPGEEPANPGFFARLFRWASADTRAQIAAHDKWLNDRATLSQRREQWEKDHYAYQEKVELRENKYAKDKAEYDKLAEEYRKDAEVYQSQNNLNLLRFESKSEAYQRALDLFGGPSYVEAKANLRDARFREYDKSDDPKLVEEYQKAKKAFDMQLDMAKAKLAAEKIREEQEYQKELQKWEQDNQEIIEENLNRKVEFEKKRDEFNKELDKWEENFLDCHDDPELIKQKYEKLENDYQEKLKVYFDKKAAHEKAVKDYEDSVKRCVENAKKQGMDPEEALEANRKIRVEEQVYEGKIDAYNKYREEHPEIKEYNDKQLEYEEKLQDKEWAEEKYNDYIEEKREYDAAKLEYDQKKAAFTDLENAKKQYKQNVDRMKAEAEKEADKQIRDREQAKKDYEVKLEQYKKDDKYWVEQKKIFDENVRKMYEPDGVHTKWEERKKAYEDANNKYKEQVDKYERDKRSFKPRHDAWEKDKKAYEAELKEYNAKKLVYDSKIEQIKKIEDANQEEWNKANEADLKDPLFKEYILNTGRYSGRDIWHRQFNGYYKIEDRKKMDLSKEADIIKSKSRTYQVMKKAAPDRVSAREQAGYELRKKERKHVSKYPSGMQGFVRDLYRAEHKAAIAAANQKELTKEAYRDAALKSMYLSVVRRKTDEIAKTTDALLGHKKGIEDVLNEDNMNYAISRMKQNKDLISRIDSQYKAGKNTEGRLNSLQDRNALNKIYDKTYTPDKKHPTVFDPVLGEKHKFEDLKKGNPMA